MDLMLNVDERGHLACTLVERDETATILAADPDAATADLQAALADLAAGGYGECVWPLTNGEYKWMFRRRGDTTDLVVIWSSGVVTGWEHVFRSTIDARTLEARVADQLLTLRKMTSPTHAGGIVYREADHRILLVRARPEPHDWVIPKGHIEAGETPEQTAVREVREEAGVEATIVGPLGMLAFTKPNGKDARVACFLLRYRHDVGGSEDRETRWCTLDEALGVIPFENTRSILAAARAALGGD